LLEARRVLSLFETEQEAEEPYFRSVLATARAIVLRAEGRHAEALSAGREGAGLLGALGTWPWSVKEAMVEAAEAALALDDVDGVEALMAPFETLAPGEATPYTRAQEARLRAKVAAARGYAEEVEPSFKRAAGLFRELGVPFWLAVTLLEHGEWLQEQKRSDDAAPLLTEAGESFQALAAQPWVERAAKAQAESQLVTRL
jgi:hypothetical protein